MRQDGAFSGAILVGALATLIGGLLVPSGHLGFGWQEFCFLAIAGTIFGVTAGLVSGSPA